MTRFEQQKSLLRLGLNCYLRITSNSFAEQGVEKSRGLSRTGVEQSRGLSRAGVEQSRG